MAHAEEIEALEAAAPWDRPAFRAGLAALSASTAAAARQLAADARVLASLAEQVPRCPGDERGGSPWTSFRDEVAVARSVSGQAAAAEVRTAVRLTSVLPHTLHLLEAGRITATRARTLAQELEPYDDELAGQLDADLADVAAGLAPWRISQEVRRAALALDADAAALRKAAATADRDVTLTPAPDGQACVLITGPAVPLTRWYATLDARARALRAAGDPRNLAMLRFDLATSTFPCLTHPPADPTAAAPVVPAWLLTPSGLRGTVPGQPARGRPWPPPAGHEGSDPSPSDVSSGPGPSHAPSADDEDPAAAGLRLSGVEAAPADCRMSRPVQAVIVVPVETALGLSQEPAWLDGYGWLDAPSSRQLLVDAELRKACTAKSSGQLVDLADRDVRPPPTPDGVRQALVDMITGESVLSDVGWRTEPEHDPSAPLRAFTALRDRSCDGPTQSRTPAERCDRDHDRPHPVGPTAAWNLVCRSRRAHQLKHYGWTPIRTASATIWTSPAGQVVEVPRQHRPAPGIDREAAGGTPFLPDADELAEVDAALLRPLTDDDIPPVLPLGQPFAPTQWSFLAGSDDAPF